MKTIGIIGGLTWVSTIEYYKWINEMVNERLGGSESAKILLYSVNFGEIVKFKETDDWDGIAKLIVAAAKNLGNAGADCLLIGANTMHHIYDKIQSAVGVPVIHIAESAAKSIKAQGLKKVALLGTKYTMQLDFYKNKLAGFGIETLIPDVEKIEFINHAIYQELGKNIFLYETKATFLQIINHLVSEGAEGIILGCTEIPLLISDEDCNVPLFNTGFLHAKDGVDFALMATN
jgi:aspartate racemase